MRVLAAFVPSESAHAHLARFVESVRGLEPSLRWTPAHLWHITLSFVADVAEDRLDDVVAAITTAAAASTPVPLRLQGAGAFPHPDRARVVWIGVDSADVSAPDDLERLALRTRAGCAAVGAAPAGHDFTAHLTLARPRHALDATPWLRAVQGYRGPSWLADEVTVFVARDGDPSGRPSYVPEATCPVGG